MGLFKKKTTQISTVQKEIIPMQYDNNNLNMTEEDYRNLLNKLRGFVPLDRRENATDMYVVFDTIYSLIYGDVINQGLATKNLSTEVVKEAFEKITKTVQESSIPGFQENLQKYKQEMNTIRSETRNLSDEYNELKMKNDELSKQNNELSIANENMNNHIKNAQNELQKLQNEIQALRKMKDSLTTVVTWDPISDDDPINNLRCGDFKNYLNSLIETYSKELNVSIEESKQVIMYNSPSLTSLFKSLYSLSVYARRDDDMTINDAKRIVKEEGYNSLIRTTAQSVIDSLPNVKLPSYTKIKTNFSSELQQTENYQIEEIGNFRR